jgi:cytochrome P450
MVFINRYGHIFSLSLPINKIVVAARPEYARYVLLENNQNYHKSLAYDMLQVLLGNGLLTSEGEFWKKQRRLLSPAFHRKKLEDLTQLMIDRTKFGLNRFKTLADEGKYVDVAPELTNITLDIISKAMFSSGVEEKADMVGKQITLLNQMATDKLNSPIRFPEFIPTPTNVKEQKSVKLLDQVIYEIIDARRKEGASKSDLLSMLLDARDEDTGEAMDDRQLRDEVMTIFIAGNETTANSLAWTLYLLSQNPDEEAKMCREIDEKLDSGTQLNFSTISEFTYVKQVIEESMRLFPPAWTVGRRNYEEDEIGGYRIRKGTNVLIPIFYMHRSPEYWDKPEKFMPERFSAENKAKMDKFVYFPFGGGPRICIGNNFALLEMQIILILFYRELRFRLKPGFEVDPEPLITLRPRYGMVMKVEKK